MCELRIHFQANFDIAVENQLDINALDFLGFKYGTRSANLSHANRFCSRE